MTDTCSYLVTADEEPRYVTAVDVTDANITTRPSGTYLKSPTRDDYTYILPGTSEFNGTTVDHLMLRNMLRKDFIQEKMNIITMLLLSVLGIIGLVFYWKLHVI